MRRYWDEIRRFWRERTYEGPEVPLQGEFDWQSTDETTMGIALEEARRAADVDRARISRLDEKAGLLAGFNGVFATLLVGLVSRTDIGLDGCWLTIFTIGFFSTVLLVLVSAVLAISILIPRTQLAIGSQELARFIGEPERPAFLQADARALSVHMLRLHVTVIHFNQWRAERKSLLLSAAYRLLAASLFPLAGVVATVGHGAVT